MFQWLLEKSLGSRLFVLVAAAVLMVWGGLQATRLPVDVFPDLNKPTVTVMTEAGGMAPEEVEQLLSFPLETAMSGLPGIANVRSISSAGLSFVYLTFDWQVDVYRARQMVSERLTALEATLPPGAVPRMGPVSSIMGEIMLVAIPIRGDGADPKAAREYADWVLRPRLMAIAGVSQVIPIGGEVRQFQVQPDTARMAALGITHEQLGAALRGFAANTSNTSSRASSTCPATAWAEAITPDTGATSASRPDRPTPTAARRWARLCSSLSAASMSLRGTVSASSVRRSTRRAARSRAARSSACWASWLERSMAPAVGTT